MIGTVTRYDRVRTFGFIQTADPETPDYFVCASFIADKQRWLMPNWIVEFTPIETDKGFEAHDVRVVRRVIARQISEKAAGRE